MFFFTIFKNKQNDGKIFWINLKLDFVRFYNELNREELDFEK